LYGRRTRIIEPCFGDILYNKRMNQFSLRGKIKRPGTVNRDGGTPASPTSQTTNGALNCGANTFTF
jgi:hypothetical protein